MLALGLWCMELQSSGIDDAMCGYPALRLGVGELCGLGGSADVPGVLGSQKSLWLSGGVFLSWIWRACGWIIVLLEPAVCVHWVLTLPQCAPFGCPRVTLCHVTKKYSVCFRHLLPSFFNCEASHLLIKYQVPLNTVTIASEKNVANHLYCANNHLHECENQIFKIEVLTPIYCCSLRCLVFHYVYSEGLSKS